jgi:hypothetical protein
MMKALFFSPYADVWVHSLPEAEIAEALRDQGWKISRITCDGVFSNHCVAMAAKGHDYSAQVQIKESVCSSCKHRQKLLQKSFGFEDFSISSLLNSQDLVGIQNLLPEISINNWMDFEIHGVPIGRMAFYDFSLTNKLKSESIPERLWPSYVSDLQNSIKTYFAVDKFMANNHVDVLVCYNGMYATNNVATHVARRHGCRTWSLHAGPHLVDRFGTMYMYESTTLPILAFESPEWKTSRSLPIESDAAAKVTDHLLELFKGSNRFVYSSPLVQVNIMDLRASLGILPHRKVLLATMSSADELFGAKMSGVLKDGSESPLFENSFEWVKFLVEHVRDRDDLHLVVRVHPREFPNKRESKTSENAEDLKTLLSSLPENVSVNWPEQQISLYGLAHIVDVVLNASSNAGIELSALGLPVVLHRVEHMLAYDARMHPTAQDRVEYAEIIDAALERGWSIENVRSAYRWWGFLFTRVAIDISDGFTYPSSGYISASDNRSAKLRNKILTLAVKYGPSIQERSQLYRRKRLRYGPLFNKALTGQSSILIAPRIKSDGTLQDENLVLALEIERLLKVLRKSATLESPLMKSLNAFVSEHKNRRLLSTQLSQPY